MLNILPGEIRFSKFVVQPLERHNHMGELVRSRIPYLCEFITWANEQGMLLEVECRSHTAKFGRIILTLGVGPDEETLMQKSLDIALVNLTRAVAISDVLGTVDASYHDNSDPLESFENEWATFGDDRVQQQSTANDELGNSNEWTTSGNDSAQQETVNTVEPNNGNTTSEPKISPQFECPADTISQPETAIIELDPPNYDGPTQIESSGNDFGLQDIEEAGASGDHQVDNTGEDWGIGETTGEVSW
jgi:hypothetical protein